MVPMGVRSVHSSFAVTTSVVMMPVNMAAAVKFPGAILYFCRAAVRTSVGDALPVRGVGAGRVEGAFHHFFPYGRFRAFVVLRRQLPQSLTAPFDRSPQLTSSKQNQPPDWMMAHHGSIHPT